jgi:hypothetical protein
VNHLQVFADVRSAIAIKSIKFGSLGISRAGCILLLESRKSQQITMFASRLFIKFDMVKRTS